MIWHHSHDVVDKVMMHSFDGEAQKHFNMVHSWFLVESSNVRLGLCIDGFNPFGLFAALYSCWSVIFMIYNLSSGMCMRLKFMFLSTVIPGPNSPSRNIDVFIHLLINKLKYLWSSRALTYDVSRKYNFQMKVALIWTINYLPVYKMVSG